MSVARAAGTLLATRGLQASAPFLAPLSVRHYGASPGSHSHAHFQVLFGLSGVLELEIDGVGQRVGAGSGCVIAPGQRHDFQARTGSRCLVLDTADSRWANCRAQPIHPGEANALATYLSHALANYPGHALRQPQALLQGFAPSLLHAAWCGAVTPVAPVSARRRAIDWLRLAAWVQQHLHRALSVADLAARVFLSPTQFAVRCRHETGYTAMQWLRLHRLAHARCLRGAGITLVETAQRCGYQSPSALTAAMRRQTAHPSPAALTVVTRQ